MDPSRPTDGYLPGYRLHPIQVGLASRDPESWEDAMVMSADRDAHVLIVEYLADGHRCRLWRSSFDFKCAPGAPVRVCERWGILAVGRRWFCINVLDPAPQRVRPVPFDLDAHRAPKPFVIVDNSNGKGIDLNHPK